jgi:hypothetical protein
LVGARLLALAAALLLPLGAAAQTRADAQRLRFEVYWGGFHSGDMMFTQEGGLAEQRTGLIMQSRGLLNWLSQLAIQSEARAEWGNPGPERIAYETRFTTRRAKRELAMATDPQTRRVELTKDKVEYFAPLDPALDADKVPPVPPEERAGVVDPLNAIQLYRHRVRQAVEADGPKRFTVKVFDGRRRFDLEAQILGKGTRNIRNRVYSVIETEARMKPISGFLERYQKMWDNALFEVRLNPEDDYVAVQIVAETFLVATMVNFLERCPAAGPCLPVVPP